MTPSKFLVITTVNAPSEGIAEFCKWPGWQVVVVGDRRTPENWEQKGAVYLDMVEQYDRFKDFAKAVPENTYTRKMMGYAYAIQHGAKAIYETDDDNIPYPDAAATVDRILAETDRKAGERRRGNLRWLNAYSLFTEQKCWPRGFPLEYLEDLAASSYAGEDDKPWAVMQFLCDDDPDVDAIYRIVDGRPIHFARDRRFMLDEESFCPLNSQSTLWTPEVFPLMFLPLGVTDRVTDILRGYIATACLWGAGYSVAYNSPIGFQARNFHDLHNDFKQEMDLYLHADEWCQELAEVHEPNIMNGYSAALEALANIRAVPRTNADVYDAFLSACGIAR
jgi:hypothetical protein